MDATCENSQHRKLKHIMGRTRKLNREFRIILVQIEAMNRKIGNKINKDVLFIKRKDLDNILQYKVSLEMECFTGEYFHNLSINKIVYPKIESGMKMIFNK